VFCDDFIKRDFFRFGVFVPPVFRTADPSSFLGMTRKEKRLLGTEAVSFG
jgi:hypothetical protein